MRVLRRMGARGEIRGEEGLSPDLLEKFARPEAVDLLRSIRPHSDHAAIVAVAAADPLNLTGIILPGPRVSRFAVMGVA